jgi:hypothetical protein
MTNFFALFGSAILFSLVVSAQQTPFLEKLKNNAPLAYISEALGHSNLKTTQNYFGRFEDESLKTFHSGLIKGMVD